MASGSTFILTMWEGKKISKKKLEEVCNQYKGEDEFSKEPKTVPLFVTHTVKRGYDYIERATRKVLVPIVEWSFCSTFTVIKEFYYMNPYDGERSIIEIPSEDIRLWLQAAKYILSGKYSDQLEDLLNNPHVSALKAADYDFFDKKVPEDALYMKEDLQRFHNVMHTCADIFSSDLCASYNENNKKDYRLLYLAW